MYEPGVSTTIHIDDNKTVYERSQDCQPVLDLTSTLRSIGAVGSNEMRHCASIPAVVVEHYCNVNGVSFHEFVNNPVHAERMLADPDLKAFRVWEGRV